jgi:hypothetical protein
MKRLLACTAVGLFLGLAPAMAESQLPAGVSPQDQPALQQPAQPSEAMPIDPAGSDAPQAPPSGLSGEAAPDQSSEAAPQAAPSAPDQSSEAAPQAAPSEPSGASPPQQSSEAPKSILPDQSAAAASDSSPFLKKQGSSDWLVGNLIGETVVNANNESLGEITDLVTDQNGKIVAVLIGSGGFLGIGQKDLAIRFEDVKLTRDENNNIKVMVNIDQQTAASAPDYETLDEQQITVGEKGDRENSTQ